MVLKQQQGFWVQITEWSMFKISDHWSNGLKDNKVLS